MTRRPRVLVALPDRTEGALVATWLSENHFEPVHRSTEGAAAKELDAATFDLVIADALWIASSAFKAAARSRTPANPTILVGDVSDHRTSAISAQTTYLTRPIDVAVLSCFVQMALMDSRPVRRSPRKAVEQFKALVNDTPADIVDVSAEGLRLEVPRVPPPYFAVRIPLVGVAIVAKRMWTKTSSKHATLWCGGALANNRASSEEAWRAFVDTVPVISIPGPRPGARSGPGTSSRRISES